jgi:hypothetical protein
MVQRIFSHLQKNKNPITETRTRHRVTTLERALENRSLFSEFLIPKQPNQSHLPTAAPLDLLLASSSIQQEVNRQLEDLPKKPNLSVNLPFIISNQNQFNQTNHHYLKHFSVVSGWVWSFY